MATSITMPQLGESVESGTIGRWLKAVGDAVALDEPLVEVITDKVNVEIPSPGAGYLVKILAEEGQTVPVGTEIAVLDEKPVAADAGQREASSTPSESPVVPQPTAAASVGAVAGGVAPTATAVAAPTGTNGSNGASADTAPRTSPLVRRLAREHGVDLAEIRGSGLGGRVTRDDILAFLEQRGTPVTPERVQSLAVGAGVAERAASGESVAARGEAPSPSAPYPAPPSKPPARHEAAAPVSQDERGDRWTALTPMRRAIAEHMVRSVSTAPHVTMCIDVDVTGVARAREALKGEFSAREGFELTYLPFVAKALCEALREHPILNAAYETGADGQPGITSRARINLGIAVGLEAGLVVPVIRDADALSVAGLARAVRELATRARSGKLSPDDLRGGTFTLNNTGAFGSIKSNPIINGGQAGILTMEAVVRRPVVVTRDGEETIAIRSMMASCLTFDHRVLDGLQAGRFMQSLKRRLESFGPGVAI